MNMPRQLLLMVGTIAGLLAAAPGHAFLIAPAPENTVEGIFDGLVFPPDIRTVTVTPGDLGGGLDRVKDVNVTIEFMKCPEDANNPLATPLPPACSDTVTASTAGEIIFRLKNPSGTQVTLVDTGTYNDTAPGLRVTVTFDDAVSKTLPGTDPATDTFQPIGLLSTFNFDPVLNPTGTAVGIWELYIEDTTATDPLGFVRFSLAINVCSTRDTDPICAQATNVPVPATALLLGLGFAGFAASRSRKRRS